jgi:photosystem II stability/assembly factor-like uncharacterized protein
MVMKIIYNLALLLLLQFSFCSDRELVLAQSSARPDSVQSQKRDNAAVATIVLKSTDGGKTWQPIDAGLPAQFSVASIIQVGENFFCGHPKGIFKSSDKGKTWKLLLPSIEGKVFNLYVSGNVIYAIPRNGGC